MSNIRKSHSNPTIALFIGQVTLPIHENQFLGCLDAAKKNNINLIIFLTREYEFYTSFQDQHNILFNLADHQEIEGIIVWPSSILNNSRNNEIIDFINNYKKVPVVFGNKEIEGFPCVIDNSYGDMKLGIKHLITDHGFRKIAFIRGPVNHQPSGRRYKAYLDILKENNIPLNENIISPHVDWTEAGEALDVMFTKKNLKPKTDIEAIVACSQTFIAGSMRYLKNRGIKVPDDIALLGFDDTEDIRAIYPPITTSYSAHYEMGYKTVELLLAKLKRQKTTQLIKVDGEVIIRKSCGCINQSKIFLDNISLTQNKNKKLSEVLNDNFCAILKVVNIIALNNDDAKQWTKILINSFTDEIEYNKENKFNNEIKKFIDTHYSLSKTIDKFLFFIISIQINFLFCLGQDPQLYLKAINIFKRTFLLFYECKDILIYKRLAKQKKLTQTLGLLERILISTFNKQDMFDILEENLPSLNIKTCYLYTCNNPIEFNKLNEGLQVSLVFAIENNRRVILDKKKHTFIKREQIIEHLISKINKDSYLLFPLLFGKELMGYIVFYFNPNESLVFETLCDIIASSLKGSNTMQQLYRIKDELVRSNKDLEQFAYVAFHDLQEPLRMVRSYLQLLEKKFKDNFDEDIIDYISFASEGSLRMYNLINGLLYYSRITSKTIPFVSFNSSELLQEVLLDLSILIKDKKAEILYDTLPEIVGDRSQIKRLFQNLISNALKFNLQEQPIVNITCKQNDKEWQFSVTDNGIGIDPVFFNKIFLLFQRLNKREQFKGNGIGLSVCKKIVERHEGRISVESELGKWTTFHFSIKKNILNVIHY
jgi:signal transduction histidine kinase/DNA-binding LacI/PurR family transcriptional regulator